MNKHRESEADNNQETDTGEVTDKQLHRWKSEGGALPPEPEPRFEDDSESGSTSRPSE